MLLFSINKFDKYENEKNPKVIYSLKWPNFLMIKSLEIFDDSSPGWLENKNMTIQTKINIINEKYFLYKSLIKISP